MKHKKTLLLLIAGMLTISTYAQNKNGNAFSLDHHWSKMAGYSYQPGYPYGFSLAGGSFLSFGFAGENNSYTLKNGENRETTWSLRCGWLGYTLDEKATGWGAITFRTMLIMGADWAKVSTPGTESKTQAYFTMAPTIAINVYVFHFSVGYEIVPKFSQINGLTFGAGFSMPLSSEDKDKITPGRNKNKR